MIEIKIPCKVGTMVEVHDEDVLFIGRILKYEIRACTSPLLDGRPERVYAIVYNQNKSMMITIYDGKFPNNVEIIG